MNDSLRVVIIDDHTLFRGGLEGLLQSRGIQVLASLGNGKEGIEQVQVLKPDVVLLDLQMEEIHGHEVLKQLIKQKVSAKIVILTTSDSDHDLIEAMQAGASGYLLKDMDPDSLVVALHQCVKGQGVFAEVKKTNIQQRAQQRDQYLQQRLTPREKETLDLLAEGYSNKVIAQKLAISEGTVKLHVKAVLRKLGVHSRVEAAVMAVVWKQNER